MLGIMRYMGQGGEINYEAALERFTKAANQSENKWAQAEGWVRLAKMHYMGNQANSKR